MGISIHALREEGDCLFLIHLLTGLNFYPRPPRGGRHWDSAPVQRRGYFYPRPPRGGRRQATSRHLVPTAISIHALREEGDGRLCLTVPIPMISIHALREEGDQVRALQAAPKRQFLSTPSARRATKSWKS